MIPPETLLYLSVPTCPECGAPPSLLRYVHGENFVAWRCYPCHLEFDSYRESPERDWKISSRRINT